VSNTDFVNSGSYLRTVFVFISGITTFAGLAGGAGFFASGLEACGGGGEGVTAVAVLLATGGWAAVFAGVCPGTAFVAEEWVFVVGVAVFTAGLAILDTAVFLVGIEVFFFAAGTLDETWEPAWATFFAAGLTILLATGLFLADFAAPDEWAGFETVFLAGAIFLTFAVFLAGFAAFFLVAIRLGFFCNKHF
jgi:hypothetical protein